MFPELFCSHKIKHKKLRKYFFHSISKLCTSQQTHADSPSGRIQPLLPSSNTLASLLTTNSRRSALQADPAPPVLQHTPSPPLNILTPIRPPGESSPFRPPTHSPLPHTTISRRFALRANPAPSRPPTHSPLPHTTISRRSALRADPAPPPVLNPRIWLRRRGTCRTDGRIGIGGMRMMYAWEAVD